MSSVVKKSAHFTPKVRRGGRKQTPFTPPTTQTSETQQEAAPPATTDAQVTPENTQDSVGRLKLFQLSDKPSALPDEEELRVDPKAAAPAPLQDLNDESDIEEAADDEDDVNNTIFKEEADIAVRRRSSAAGRRRLSVILALGRAGSISAPPVGENDEIRAAPVTIDIPVKAAPKLKARRASLSSQPPPKRVSLVEPPIRETHESDGDGAAADDKVDASKRYSVSRAEIATTSSNLIAALDPETQKFRVFRKGPGTTPDEEKNYSLAPPELVTMITNKSQLPRRRLKKEEEEYFAALLVSPDMTMEDLCKPLFQIGEQSSNVELVRTAQEKISAARKLRQAARKRARIAGISYRKALQQLEEAEELKQEQERKKNAESAGENVPDPGPVPPPSDSDPVRSTVQILVGANGQMAIDEDSITVSRQDIDSTRNWRKELENPFENPINAGSYSKHIHTDNWTVAECETLYNALSKWGTDFTLIAQLFPHRTRRQIKRKYILEEKLRPELVELALKRPLRGDLDVFLEETKLSTPGKTLEDFHEDIRNLRREHERHMEEITMEREKAHRADLEASLKREVQLRTGSKPISRIDPEEIRKNEVVVGSVVKKPREDLDD